MRSLIIGMGEVGSAIYEVLREHHDVETLDLDHKEIRPGFDVMHVCIRHSDDFLRIVSGYEAKYRPTIIDVCSTVPPKTTETLGDRACHSTTRGLNPNLSESLRTFVKHIGGPRASYLADYYRHAGIKTRTHATAKTTELAHILSNSMYGVGLMFADEASRLCRENGVDYMEAVVEYNQTSNQGYLEMGHRSKMRMILTPPGGKIGGHCVVQNARLLQNPTPLIQMLVRYA